MRPWKLGLLSVGLLLRAAPASAQCDLAELCPTPEPAQLCAAANACFDSAFSCVQDCALQINPQACIDACKNSFVTCGIANYAPGADCYPCVFDPDLCSANPPPVLELRSILEGWQSAAVQEYVPIDSPTSVTSINGDSGVWVVNDTVSSFPECGPTPQRAEIVDEAGDRVLRLRSVNTQTGCADNVWVNLVPNFPAIGNEFAVPFDESTTISFEAGGQLVNARPSSPFCLVPPRGDTVNLRLEDRNGNTLAYLIRRAPTATPNEVNPFYREIFLNETQSVFARNLFDDFSTIPEFTANDPNGHRIVSIVFELDEHGSASLDDLCIGHASCRAVPEPSQTMALCFAALALLGLRQPLSGSCRPRGERGCGTKCAVVSPRGLI